MAFQIKDLISIVAAMVNYATASQTKLTDFRPGSTARTMLEAPATEIEECYQQMFNGLKEAIPVAIYNGFEFDAITAMSAIGPVQITITAASQPVLIAAGSTFIANDGGSSQFVSLSDCTILAGQTTAATTLRAVVPGTTGNIQSGTTFTIVPGNAAVISTVAQAQFYGGMDDETLDQRKTRFQAYIRSIDRTSISALEFGIRSAAVLDANGLVAERAKFIVIDEPYTRDPTQPIALVNAYVHNGIDGASAALLSQIKSTVNGYYDANGNPVPGWKAAGIPVVIYAAQLQPVNITMGVSVDPSFDATASIAAVSAAISNYILNLGIGSPVILAEIVNLAMDIAGVINVHIATPSSDVAVAMFSKASVGNIAVSPV